MPPPSSSLPAITVRSHANVKLAIVMEPLSARYDPDMMPFTRGLHSSTFQFNVSTFWWYKSKV